MDVEIGSVVGNSSELDGSVIGTLIGSVVSIEFDITVLSLAKPLPWRIGVGFKISARIGSISIWAESVSVGESTV